jgi:hypothetical protein
VVVVVLIDMVGSDRVYAEDVPLPTRRTCEAEIDMKVPCGLPAAGVGENRIFMGKFTNGVRLCRSGESP